MKLTELKYLLSKYILSEYLNFVWQNSKSERSLKDQGGHHQHQTLLIFALKNTFGP